MRMTTPSDVNCWSVQSKFGKLLSGQKGVLVPCRHAKTATEVTAVDDRDPQVVQRSPESSRVDTRARGQVLVEVVELGTATA